MPSIALSSSAFKNNDPIPVKYSGEGQDVSPPLTWSEPPAGTREFVLILDDPDAPMKEPWVHWVVYKIPANDRQLVEALPRQPRLPSGLLQGQNSWNKVGYNGPLPGKGSGVHHYRFTLYALDNDLGLSPELSKQSLLNGMKGHILAQGQLVGTYERK